MAQRQPWIIRKCAKLRAKIPDLREQVEEKREQPALSERPELEQIFSRMKAYQQSQQKMREKGVNK